nr:hypothetical protein [Tanacetum cinerariifolium]
MITLSMCYKTTLASDTLIDFQIKFSLSIGGIVTHWFTLIAMSALRRSDNENMLSLMNLYLCQSFWICKLIQPNLDEGQSHIHPTALLLIVLNPRNIKMEVKRTPLEVVFYALYLRYAVRHASGHAFHPGPVWGCDRLVSRAKVIENQIMAISVISVSSDSLEESVGTSAG